MLAKRLDHMNCSIKGGKALLSDVGTVSTVDTSDTSDSSGEETSGTEAAPVFATTSLFDDNSIPFDLRAPTLVVKEKVEHWPQEQRDKEESAETKFSWSRPAGPDKTLEHWNKPAAQQAPHTTKTKKNNFVRASDLLACGDLIMLSPTTAPITKTAPPPKTTPITTTTVPTITTDDESALRRLAAEFKKNIETPTTNEKSSLRRLASEFKKDIEKWMTGSSHSETSNKSKSNSSSIVQAYQPRASASALETKRRMENARNNNRSSSRSGSCSRTTTGDESSESKNGQRQRHGSNSDMQRQQQHQDKVNTKKGLSSSFGAGTSKSPMRPSTKSPMRTTTTKSPMRTTTTKSPMRTTTTKSRATESPTFKVADSPTTKTEAPTSKETGFPTAMTKPPTISKETEALISKETEALISKETEALISKETEAQIISKETEAQTTKQRSATRETRSPIRKARSTTREKRSLSRARRGRSRLQRVEPLLLGDTKLTDQNTTLQESPHLMTTSCSSSSLESLDRSRSSSSSSSSSRLGRRPGAAEENRRRWVSRGVAQSPTIPVGSSKSPARRSREQNDALGNVKIRDLKGIPFPKLASGEGGDSALSSSSRGSSELISPRSSHGKLDASLEQLSARSNSLTTASCLDIYRQRRISYMTEADGDNAEETWAAFMEHHQDCSAGQRVRSLSSSDAADFLKMSDGSTASAPITATVGLDEQMAACNTDRPRSASASRTEQRPAYHSEYAMLKDKKVDTEVELASSVRAASRSPSPCRRRSRVRSFQGYLLEGTTTQPSANSDPPSALLVGDINLMTHYTMKPAITHV